MRDDPASVLFAFMFANSFCRKMFNSIKYDKLHFSSSKMHDVIIYRIQYCCNLAYDIKLSFVQTPFAVLFTFFTTNIRVKE